MLTSKIKVSSVICWTDSRVKCFAATVCAPCFLSDCFKVAFQTAPNAPEPIIFSSFIRSRATSHSSTSWTNSSSSSPGCSSARLQRWKGGKKLLLRELGLCIIMQDDFNTEALEAKKKRNIQLNITGKKQRKKQESRQTKTIRQEER